MSSLANALALLELVVCLSNSDFCEQGSTRVSGSASSSFFVAREGKEAIHLTQTVLPGSLL